MVCAAFEDVESVADVRETTLDIVAWWLDPDVSVIAAERAGGWEPLVSQPADWTDKDGLLEPVSLPCRAVADEEGCHVDDAADVRSATAPSEQPAEPTLQYRSLFAVPFGDDDMLLVGSHEPGAFPEAALEDLRQLCTYAASLQTVVEHWADRQAASERLQQAAAALDHDAKNQLTILRGTLDLAEGDLEPADAARLERGVDGLATLIEDTTTLLRSGRMVTDVEAVDLESLAKRTWAALDTVGASLEVAQVGEVRADRSRLAQMLDNLFRNALDHIDGEVAVQVGPLEDGAGFFVADDGPGIPEADREDIFEFGRSAAGSHTGYGLTIARWIAEAHGWELTVTKAARGGARFEVRGMADGPV
ncbi:sensor histidine kinase [Halobacteriales archaeon Cl-PHB]